MSCALIDVFIALSQTGASRAFLKCIAPGVNGRPTVDFCLL